MGLMTLGAVLVLGDGLTAPATAQVGSDPVALVEDLHRGRRGADFHDLLHQSVRHTVFAENSLSLSNFRPFRL